MIIKFSETISLGEWYKVGSGEWARQSIDEKSVNTPFESRGTSVYFYHNVCDTFGLQFTGLLRGLKVAFKSIYPEGLNFPQDQEEEAKQFVDNFLIKMSGLKAFV